VSGSRLSKTIRTGTREHEEPRRNGETGQTEFLAFKQVGRSWRKEEGEDMKE
jgi:hypothetical protein